LSEIVNEALSKEGLLEERTDSNGSVKEGEDRKENDLRAKARGAAALVEKQP
jgi:hypothetical protein